MGKRTIFITEDDRQRIGELIAVAGETNPRDQDRLKDLAGELDRARVVPRQDLPPTVVTMHSKVRVRDADTREIATYTLVYPEEANADENRISVVSPIGTALLGYTEGATIVWPVPGGKRRLVIEKVLYQPEAAGHAPA